MHSRTRLAVAVGTLIWAGLALLPGNSRATLPMQKDAKAGGFAVKDCTYCHVEKLPKKGAVTHNERGKWLVDEKVRRKADAIDVKWLKEYPGDKK